MTSSPIYLRLGTLLLFSLSAASALSQTRPLSVYLAEGFDTPGIPAGWTFSQVSGTTSSWSIVGVGSHPPIAPYSGSGQAEFNSYDATAGHQSRLTSARVNMSGSTDPFLNFFIHHDNEFFTTSDSVYVEATTGDSIAGPWTTLAGYRRPQAISTWRNELVSLLQYTTASRLFIGFRGVSQYGNNIHIDEVRIADSAFHDIGITAPTGSSSGDGPSPLANNSRFNKSTTKNIDSQSQVVIPLAMHLASPMDLNVLVQNYGTFAETSYQVRWQIDGQNQPPANNSRILQRNGRDTLTLTWSLPVPGTHVVNAWTSLSADSNRMNDSLKLTIAVLDSMVFFAELFNGTTFPPSGWSVINRDGGALPPWFAGSSTSIFLPYEGAGFAADNFQRANATYIDDYLISPPIPNIGQSGRPDSLKFWTRSASNPPPATNYPDSLMVLLSTSGSDTSNFTILLDYFLVPKTGWTLKQYPLSGRVPPNSTIRIAFRYLHFAGGQSGANSDFVGIDFVNLTKGLPTGVDEPQISPSSFRLLQNFPNPFNPSTEVDFSVESSGEVTLDLYNILGEKVSTLFSGSAEKGIFYKIRVDGSHFASGVYYYRLQSGTKSEIRRLILQR